MTVGFACPPGKFAVNECVESLLADRATAVWAFALTVRTRACHSENMASTTKLMTDAVLGLTFEYLHGEETEFIFEEIFSRRSYLQHGIQVPLGGAPVIIDAGANIGLFSLQCLKENASARIFAVEPAPAAFRCLERNLGAACTSHGATVCLQSLLCEANASTPRSLHWYNEAPGESTCYPAERRRQRAKLRAHARTHPLPIWPASAEDRGEPVAANEAEAEVIPVAAVTLSSCLATWDVAQVDLLKVDVEGDELNVLRGISAADWPRIRQVVVEVHDVHGRLDGVLRLLRRHGFSVAHELQEGGVVNGYEMVVPASLRLYYVYATRPAADGKALMPVVLLRAQDESASGHVKPSAGKKQRRW